MILPRSVAAFRNKVWLVFLQRKHNAPHPRDVKEMCVGFFANHSFINPPDIEAGITQDLLNNPCVTNYLESSKMSRSLSSSSWYVR